MPNVIVTCTIEKVVGSVFHRSAVAQGGYLRYFSRIDVGSRNYTQSLTLCDRFGLIVSLRISKMGVSFLLILNTSGI